MTDSTELLRLNRYIALHTASSRREADNLIASGIITVNGAVATLGARIAPGDDVRRNGTPIQSDGTYAYLVLNKPPGYVCSRRKQGDAETIYSLLPTDYHHLKPVGRLDKDSTGLLLLSNDGDFTYQMTHPKFYKHKIYLVTLNRDLEPLHQQMINDFGIQLEDGPSKLSLERLSDDNRTAWRVTMSEGRNRQIRRTFDSLGYTVTKLHRTNFGDYSLGDIKPGNYKSLDIR